MSAENVLQVIIVDILIKIYLYWKKKGSKDQKVIRKSRQAEDFTKNVFKQIVQETANLAQIENEIWDLVDDKNYRRTNIPRLKVEKEKATNSERSSNKSTTSKMAASSSSKIPTFNVVRSSSRVVGKTTRCTNKSLPPKLAASKIPTNKMYQRQQQ